MTYFPKGAIISIQGKEREVNKMLVVILILITVNYLRFMGYVFHYKPQDILKLLVSAIELILSVWVMTTLY